MKVTFENVISDKNSSFCTIHINVPVADLKWEYHYHPEVELVCVMSGSGTRHVGYHKSNFKNGDLVLIGSNVPHSGFGLNSLDPHEEIVLQFKEEIIKFPDSVVESSAINKMISLSKLGILFHPKVKKSVIPKLRHILETEPSKRYILFLDLLFFLSETKDYTLLNKEVMPYTIISRNKERLQSIFTYVEKNYHQEIDIALVANLVNLTLPSFCNFFKKTMQITFTEFVNRYRIDKACTLLIQDKSISESCYLCGYNNVTYFNRIFKKYIKKTPSAFKNEMVM